MFVSCNNNNHCGNGVQDGDETGVDCGGSCVALCPTTNNNNNLTPTIGEYYQGGLVFYLDGNGGGLIAAPTDQSSNAFWDCHNEWDEIIGADGTAVGTGNQNPLDIEAGCTAAPDTNMNGTPHQWAADICANLTLDGYSDWFLPSLDELNLMYQNICYGTNVGGFDYEYYWSSSECGQDFAYRHSFATGGLQWCGNKSEGQNVRAVRAF